MAVCLREVLRQLILRDFLVIPSQATWTDPKQVGEQQLAEFTTRCFPARWGATATIF